MFSLFLERYERSCKQREVGLTPREAMARYGDAYARRKVMNFAKAFLKYLSKTRFDTRYKEFDLFLEMPKAIKESKRITQRIVTTDDVKNVLSAIEQGGEHREFTDATVPKLQSSCSVWCLHRPTSYRYHPQTHRRAVSGRSTAQPSGA